MKNLRQWDITFGSSFMLLSEIPFYCFTIILIIYNPVKQSFLYWGCLKRSQFFSIPQNNHTIPNECLNEGEPWCYQQLEHSPHVYNHLKRGHRTSHQHMLSSGGHWHACLIMQVQTERRRVKALTTNLDWRRLRSPPRVLQTPLEEMGWRKRA